MIIKTDETIDLKTPTGLMRCHIFRPVAEGKYSSVIFYSEIYQVTQPIRRLASYIAGQGYIVIVPEVYHEYEPLGTVFEYDKEGTDRGNCLKFEKPISAYDSDAYTVIEWAKTYEHCNGKVGTMGVCLGGHLALRAALHPNVLAAACFYATNVHDSTLGQGKKDDTIHRLSELKGETMFVFGRQDPHVPFEGRLQIQQALYKAEASYEWHEFNAQHAFLRDEGPRYDAALFQTCMGLVISLFARNL
ncbi:dienelactone hydrolase family protein [Commensalibacter papalotli (ex Servin-Garciduenas et al. 2014)]|uniref:Carboxymethylenebutenolidase n=1 Tax=Commensalibacter papalotli (ex Servin-Garciduenas et al. 2014) TaxID=1208583 RepID=W7DYS1_9PROT|nr:dienelactone hydrolase family protein [Commensalibacter papalotli (ex Servin-Garciduenas et al. 2014)]EUK17849.1 carboxymethylenebutenolidase [Commensalibacter papalotli (ex Servin-Garciduenas et al. 2014)]